jgi:beta-lactam-binding protein with PASTA domain
MQTLWAKIRHMGIELYCFVTTGVFIKNFAAWLGLWAFLFVFLFWWLTCYTRHGESLQVPNFVGMSVKDAARKAERRSLEVEISDSLFVEGEAPGRVVEQSPAANSRVKVGRTLYLTITKFQPDEVTLPSIFSGSDELDTYTRKLARLGVRYRVAARVFDARLEENTILHVLLDGDTVTQLLDRGVRVDKGATIDLIVTERGGTTVPIPDLVCMRYDAARFLLNSNNLSVGTVDGEDALTDKASAYVWRQEPAFDPEGVLRMGRQVDLYLIQERPTGCPEEER